MSALPDDLLERSADEGARRVALAILSDAKDGLARLDDPDDVEALHDFRVAVRRLRSVLKGFDGVLSSNFGKDEKRLRAVQNGTGGGRDAEVFLEWLAPQRAEHKARQRAGYEWLVAHLTKRRRADEGHEEAKRTFESASEKLEARLVRMQVEMRLDRPLTPGESFARALARILRAHVELLAGRLAKVRGPEDATRAHSARIAAKRLRYLVEPARDHVAGVREVLQRMKRLQDVLGELNDSHHFAAELLAAMERASEERAQKLASLEGSDSPEARRELRRTEQPGLLAIGVRIQERIDALFATLRAEWLEGGARSLVSDIEAVASELEHRKPDGVEIERKYLLSGMPETAIRFAPSVLAQGYVPGDKLVERVRSVEDAGGTRYFRTVKLGRGISRVEVEEETSAAIFRALYALTEGKRVHKRRYRVPEGDLVWEVDEFVDRDLVLAEVELPSASIDPAVPAWLAPHVVREVTEEAEYVNVNLAR